MTLLIAYILNIIDYLFTRHWVNLYGIDIEANLMGRLMFSHNVTLIFKIFVVGSLFALLGYCIKREPSAAWVAYIPLAVYGLIVLYHIGLAIYIAITT